MESNKLNIEVDRNLLKEEVKVFAPATVANMVCGYDVLGFALEEPGDLVIMKRSDTPGVLLKSITGDDGRLPMDPTQNTVSACCMMLLEDLGLTGEIGVEIELHKQMPIGSGLGSSAASTVGGVFALNELLGSPLSREELLPYCLHGEEIACGHPHPDNVTPALMGGITLIRSDDPLDVVNLPVPDELFAAVVFPKVDVPTRDAREMIKNRVLLKDAVKQWGNIAGLVAGLFRSDYQLIGRSMEDVLIEPVRSILIPEFAQMKKIALSLGALSFGISGSGPTVLAMCKSAEEARAIKDALSAHLESVMVECYAYSSKVNAEGPKCLSN